MRAFGSVLKMNIKKEFQYRTAAISGLLTQLFFGLMQIALYRQFLMQGNDGFSIAQMTSYIWLQQIFYTLFKFWDGCKYEISEKIVNGDVGYQLIRPMNLYDYWYSNVFSKSLGMVIVRGIPFVIIAILIPGGLALPSSIEGFLMFVISAALGAFLVAGINMFSYILVLYTLSPQGVFSFMVAVSSFLAGQIVPIPMFPTMVQKILNFFPFRYVADLPFRIYVGNIAGMDALIQILIQLAWLVAVVIIGKLIIHKKVKNIVVQGG